MARRREQPEASGGETTTGHLGPPAQRGPVSEQLSCVVIRATADGYVVGKALVDAGAVSWLSPTHVRDWQESRPTDVKIPALIQANIGGNTELKPARTAKGVPVMTTVAKHVVFGEELDAATHRAIKELKRIIDVALKNRRVYWRHKCQRELHVDIVTGASLPKWRGLPLGEACECGAVEPKRSAA